MHSETSISSDDRLRNFKRLRTLRNATQAAINPIRMVHENIDLREQLKALNLKLNQLLDHKAQQKKAKKKHSSPENMLLMAQKQIEHYK
jgi:hypothetical protein